MKTRMTAEQARKKTYDTLDSLGEFLLDEIFEKIEVAVGTGKYECSVKKKDDKTWPDTVTTKLCELGYKVQYGTSIDRNETYEDRSILVIKWNK